MAGSFDANLLNQLANPTERSQNNMLRRQRIEEEQRQGLTRNLAGAALRGEAGAMDQLSGVDPDAYMTLEKRQQAKAAEQVDKIARTLYSAQDPQSWAQAVQMLKSQGIEFDPGEDAFENREALIGQAIDLKNQIEAGKDVRNFNALQDYRTKSLAQRGGTADKTPSGYRPTIAGDLEAIPGGPADPKVKASQGAGGVTTKMRNDAVAVDQAFRSLDKSLTDYEAMVKKTGLVALPGQESDTVQQARTNLQLQLKELYNLGVLNGPDLSLMEQMIFDPQTKMGFTDPVGNLGKMASAAGLPGTTSIGDRASASITQLREILKTVRDNKTKGILDERGQFAGGAGTAPAAPAAPEGDGGEIESPLAGDPQFGQDVGGNALGEIIVNPETGQRAFWDGNDWMNF